MHNNRTLEICAYYLGDWANPPQVVEPEKIGHSQSRLIKYAREERVDQLLVACLVN